MADTRIVAIVGPRQVGQEQRSPAGSPAATACSSSPSTTSSRDGSRKTTRQLSASGLQRAVIDEIQRAPNLILALKRAVDEDSRPGRFLITGSVEAVRRVAVAGLAGRTRRDRPSSCLSLRPRSPARKLPRSSTGRSHATSQGLETVGRTDDLVERVVRGGFPEALSRTAPARRRTWLRNYARVVAEHDVRDIAQIAQARRAAPLDRPRGGHSRRAAQPVRARDDVSAWTARPSTAGSSCSSTCS